MSPFNYKCQLGKVDSNACPLISHPDTTVYLFISGLVLGVGACPFMKEKQGVELTFPQSPRCKRKREEWKRGGFLK
jgi:hypothetical protein